MHPLQLRERVERQTRTAAPSSPTPSSVPKNSMRPMRLENVTRRPATTVNTAQTVRVKKVEEQLTHQSSPRVQHELKEMQETDDLRNVDDDVEDLATLYEWNAVEHNHRPKSPRWFIALASGTTVAAATLALLGNIMGTITIAALGAFTYYVAQRHPNTLRYRILVDGVAMNNVLYHYRDLAAFNIVYEPGETKTVILRSKHLFTPLLHMEVGDADPVAMRDILLEFLPEDQEMDEPLADVIARRLGF